MVKIFSGRGNQQLSDKVAKILKTNISKAEVVTFKNSEIRVRIEEQVKNDICVVIQPTANPSNDNLMELFFFCDALHRQEAKQVIGIIPYFGYARQDIQHRSGECISANVIIRFLESIGFNKIYVFDLHDEATEGVFSIPFKNLSALPLLADKIKEYLKIENPDVKFFSIVSPDQGGIERARQFGTFFFGHDFFSVDVIEKKRDPNILHHTKALNLYGDVKGKIAILVDDIITSGRTLINGAALCSEKGAKEILVAVVHHELSHETTEKLNTSAISRFFSTDTIPLDDALKFEKLEELSVAGIIAEEIKTL
ncbi:hypothetical protein A3C23_00540 [Candidatus Roizmanbacteria bacterium RIFCSPHIGHO2_02_FULL_37_13b]|uniref:ribose-phosphate diphosphokinase n=1 Tax=Candidatus Roizmanbacteria bacterium RIFCSPLOWO2_02_FULL_36_11 TaxID=1802071 RepID=A0A1F7JD15_9BACT|nr:MAG: hypothetical protein A3C23_00540 [Candidatus Roizmanbacteria bacterium RIFCSPHIGHO2_02_FULL_37_13b]OGK53487.1 MAG: hypothetical protein A3H78_04650 [Candidatus Roizmanbacteria bacterium RIFCSPLOWO2_02_FULL_36_11]